MAPIDYLMMDSMELARQIKEQEQERPEEQQPEIIRAAAVRHIPSGKFTEGFSHFDAALVAERRKDPNNYEVGFTTNRGRFVDRGEAHQIAKSANQIGKTEDEHLGAEDLGPDRFVPDTERKIYRSRYAKASKEELSQKPRDKRDASQYVPGR